MLDPFRNTNKNPQKNTKDFPHLANPLKSWRISKEIPSKKNTKEGQGCRIFKETLGPGNSGKNSFWGDFLGEMRMVKADMLGRIKTSLLGKGDA